MKANEGTLDRLARTGLGVVLLGVGLGLIQGTAGLIVGIVGLVPLLTGLSGWCPLYALLRVSTLHPDARTHARSSSR